VSISGCRAAVHRSRRAVEQRFARYGDARVRSHIGVFRSLQRMKCRNPCRAYCSWTWSAFRLRVVRVTHDVWIRPLCTKRVRFDHVFAGTRARTRRIQKGQKSEHGFLRRSEAGATRLGHTFLGTKSLQPPSGHHFWTLGETVTPCRETRLFPILF
jgi:hypothetical protein